MRLKSLIPLAVFIAVLAVHGLWSMRAMKAPSRTVCITNAQGQCVGDETLPGTGTATLRDRFAGYLSQQDYFLGFSYALAFAFAAWALLRLRQDRKGSLVGALAGLSLGSILAAAGCFLVGCCGSPMLAVWLGLFGAKAVGLAKPVVAGVTALSVVGGYFWMRRRGPACCAGSCAAEEGA